MVWTGKEARTSEFVRAVRAFEARDPAGYALACATVSRTRRVASPMPSPGRRRRDHRGGGGLRRGMGELGQAAGVTSSTAELAQIAELARVHGGAAKPSGAGGGDVAIAFFQRRVTPQAFDAACRSSRALGLAWILGLGAPRRVARSRSTTEQ